MDQKEALFILDVSSLPLSLASVLSPSDQERFSRYRQDNDKALFLGGRLLIRHFIGKGELSFLENKKPYIKGVCPFSISHAYPYVALAYAPYPIGADIESIRRLESTPVTKFFPEEDIEHYPDLGELWCYKEAIYKASGVGYLNPKEPLIQNQDGSFSFRDGTYYAQSQEYHGYRLVVMAKEPFSLPAQEISYKELID